MHHPESRSDAQPTIQRGVGRAARVLIRKMFNLVRDQRHDELARRSEICALLTANPDHVTFVFHDGDCDPPYYTQSFHVVATPTLQQFLAWERSDLRDGCFADLRATRLADWQLSGQMRAIPMSDLALRFRR